MSLAARIRGRGDRAAAGRAAARARPHPAPLPAVLRVRDPRRLDRDPGRRPLRDPGDPHRRPGRVGAGDHPARHLGEPAAAGIGRRPLPGPDADRLRGHPRRRSPRPGCGCGPRPEFKASAAVEFERLPRRRRARSARSPSPACDPANCRLLDASEAELTGAGDGSANLLILGFESAHHPVDASMDIALDDSPASTAAPPSNGPADGPKTSTRRRRNRPTDAEERRGGRSPGGGRSCWRRICATRSSPAGCSRRPSRRRSPGTGFEDFHADRDGRGARTAVAEVSGAAARGSAERRASAAASPTSTPTASPPTSRCWPRPCAAARSSSGTRSRPRSPRR